MGHHRQLLVFGHPVEKVHRMRLGVVVPGNLLRQQAQQKRPQMEVMVEQPELLQHQFTALHALGVFIFVQLLAQLGRHRVARNEHALHRSLQLQFRIAADKLQRGVDVGKQHFLLCRCQPDLRGWTVLLRRSQWSRVSDSRLRLPFRLRRGSCLRPHSARKSHQNQRHQKFLQVHPLHSTYPVSQKSVPNQANKMAFVIRYASLSGEIPSRNPTRSPEHPILCMTTDTKSELAAILTGAAVFPLDDRAFLRITGSDATRWLNGMVTNSIQSLAPREGNYNFLLNAQGRIQGDCTIYREPREEPTFLLETDAAQIDAIRLHLDRFIIMDDVELAPVEDLAGILVAGPQALSIVMALGTANHQ